MTVTRNGECGQYIYQIQWLSKDDQPTIIIVNSTNTTSVSVSTVVNGNDASIFYNLPTDLMRTYHTEPQVSL